MSANKFGCTFTGDPFLLPADMATQKIAFLARSGAGKTYAASKLAELLHAAGAQFVVLDPVGVWYGLRLAANGRDSGLSIPVFGGEYGDIPLEPGAGALVANLVVDRGVSLILDVSGFRKGQRREFVTAFAEELFHRKKTARSPIMLFLEESQFFIPQYVFKGGEMMLGAFEDIGKVGRNYGIGLTLISQRPQAINKEVLNQTEALFVLQTNGSQERKAIRDWIDAQGINAGAAVEELPNLEIGEAMVWSPQWLKFFGKVRVDQKWTYNASATPTFDTAAVTPRPLEQKDLETLREAMQEVVEHAEAKDPAALRRRITELERRLRECRQVEKVIERVEVPVLPEEDLNRLAAIAKSLSESSFQLSTLGQSLVVALNKVKTPVAPVEQPKAPPHPAPAVNGPKPENVRDHYMLTETTSTSAVPQLKPGERRILAALVRRYPLKFTRTQLATVSGFTPSSGTYSTYLGNLRRSGFLEEEDGESIVTPAGLNYLGYDTPLAPQTTEEILDMWRASLNTGERRMFDTLVEAYPGKLTRDELALKAGFTASSGTFNTYLGKLRRNGLAEVTGKHTRASSALFITLYGG